MSLELDAFLKSPEFLNLSGRRSTLAEFLFLCQRLRIVNAEFVLYHPRPSKAPKEFLDQWFTVGFDERTILDGTDQLFWFNLTPPLIP